MTLYITHSLIFLFPASFLFLIFFIPKQEIKTIPAIQSYSTTTLPIPHVPNTTHQVIHVEKCDQLKNGLLEESYSMESSTQSCWWLDSGALFNTENSIGKSISGNLSENSFWRVKYMESNPEDTENGFRPQNILRLINRKKWGDVSQSMIFKINKYDLSTSKNRNISNGVLLMSRYQDSDNLYYAGIRVDGTVVIKKKYEGLYTTLATKKYIFDEKYDPESKPILIQTNTWIAEKFITKNNPDGSVNLRLYVNMSTSQNLILLLEVNDSLEFSGKPPLRNSGNIGIRSDFMDIEISNFRATLI